MRNPNAPKRVLIITDVHDTHIPFVSAHLSTPSVVIDPRELLAGKELSYRSSSDAIKVSYDNESLDDVAGVWYRKPQRPKLSEVPVPAGLQEYSQTALNRHFNLLLTAFDKANWVSDYYAITRANNKPWQLALANRVGFRVPDTLFTSSQTMAQEFLKGHPRSVTKPLSPKYPKINGKQQVFLTTLIDHEFTPDLRGLPLAPAIFQEAIDVDHEVRAIVVGEQVFAAIVQSNTPDAKNADRIRDSRFGHYEGTVQITAAKDFPADIARMCIAHTKALGLHFGAVDLIRDKKGLWWFLENNPNGQWAYVEKATGQQIGAALANLLTKQ